MNESIGQAPDSEILRCSYQTKEEIRVLQPDTSDPQRHLKFITYIGQQETSERLNPRNPAICISPEYALPGLGFDGGLGVLMRCYFLQNVDLGKPAIFFGGRYSHRKRQTLVFRDGYYQQDIVRDPLPKPEDIGMKLTDNLHVELIDPTGSRINVNVYEYPIKNTYTRLLLLDLSGEVYPDEPSSDARLWNDLVLGFGPSQIIKQLKDQNSIEDPAYYLYNESQTTIGALATLDNLVMEYGDNDDSYKTALRKVRHESMLTNHTLVPAAEACFTSDQCERYIMSNFKSDVVKRELRAFIRVRGGQLRLLDLALYLASKYNAVSMDHAKRATRNFRKQYGTLYYGNRIEFTGITNGIYEKGWNSRMVAVLEKHNVIDTFGLPVAQSCQENIDTITTDELVENKNTAVNELRRFLNEGGRTDQFGNRITIPEDAIIIGDARRVTDYKRRWMLFQNPERLKKYLQDHPRAYFFLSGKAHPADRPAQQQLEYILNTIAGNELFKKRIFYLPDWDPVLATKLIPACSLWLNTPRVGEEACGTSGMKAGLGGALCVSTKDGFFAELPPEVYYAIEGDTNSEAEYSSYYTQMENATNDVQDIEKWAQRVKVFWKSDFLKIASGARMDGVYTYFALPPSPAQAFDKIIYHNAATPCI
jgi:starch phosphorylase